MKNLTFLCSILLLLLANVVNAQITESIPYTQNFDAFPQGSTLFNPTYVLSEGWFNETNDDMDWTANSGATPTVSTGPSSDNTTGTGKYLYIESSSSANRNVNMLSPLIDLNGASTETVLSFFYHMFGNSMGNLEVEISIDSGTTFTQLIAPFTDNKDEWQQKTISLSPYIDNIVQFRFKGTTKASSFRGDMAIDDFFVGRDIKSIPYTQNFDAMPLDVITSNPVYTLTEEWFNEKDDDIDWVPTVGATATLNTGPSSDNTTGSGKYLYVESSAKANKRVNMLSPLIDLTNAPSNTGLSFFYHMFGNSMGTLEVEISTDLGATFTQLIAPFTDNKDAWQQSITNLSPYVGNIVQFRFKGTTLDTGFQGDLAVDDFFVGELPNTVITNVTSSVANGFYSEGDLIPIQLVFNEAVTVTGTPQLRLETGSTDQTINYKSGSGTNTLTFDYRVQPGDFSIKLDYINASSLSLNEGTIKDTNGENVLTQLPTQGSPGSLSQNKTIVVDNLKSIPYNQNFDAFIIPDFIDNNPIYELSEGWFNELDDDIDWVANSGETRTSNTGPISDHTSRNGNYLYIEANTGANKKINMLSPFIDLTNAPTNTELSFFYHMQGSSMGTLEVEISTDLGVTFTQLIAPFTDNNTQWQEKTINLSSFTGEKVQFRFKGTTIGGNLEGDIAIDDFFVGVLSKSLPYTQNFDAFPQGPTTSNSTYVLSEEWFNETDDDMDWTVNTGATPSTSTGPSSDNTTGNDNYIYIEADSQANRNVSMLSPFIDLRDAESNTSLSFFYHMFGSTMGTLEVEISTDFGATFTQLVTPFTDNLDKWQQSVTSLQTYIGNIVQFRIKGTTVNTGDLGDIAIDDFFVGIVPPFVKNVTSISSKKHYLEGEQVFITVEFNQQVTVAGTPQLTLQTGSTDQVIDYTGTDGGNGLVFTYTVQPGDFSGDLDYINVNALTLNGGFIQGPRSINASLKLPEPGSKGSLSHNKTIKIGEIKKFPYVQNFDAFPPVATTTSSPYELSEEWFNEINDDMDWNVRSGNTPTFATGPSSDNTSGNGNYIFIEADGGLDRNVTMLSPLIDLTNVPTETALSFFYHMFGNNMGTLEVEISTDFGETFSQLVAPFTDNKDEWQKSVTSLSPYIGNVVQFRFIGTALDSGSQGDMAIDDFSVGVLSESIPYTQNFNAFPQGPTSSNPTYVLSEGWFNETNDDMDWTANSGATPTSGTGPTSDNPSPEDPTGTGRYLYIEADAQANRNVNMLSPFIDLNGASTDTVLSFFYHMFGTSMGTLEVEISTDLGATFTQLIAPFTDDKNVWQNKTINLSPYIENVVQFRFKGTTLACCILGNMAIDDFFVGVFPTKVTNVSSSVADGDYPVGSLIPVELVFEDIVTVTGTPQLTLQTGSTDQVINYSSGSGSNTLVFNYTVKEEDFTGDLDYTNTIALKLNGGSIQDSNGDSVFLRLPKPGTTGSLSQNKTIKIGEIKSIPYTQNFDTFPQGPTNEFPIYELPEEWFNEINDDSDWTINSGPTSTTNTGPSSDNTTVNGSGNYIYIESDARKNMKINLLSPLIDLRDAPTSTNLSFFYHMLGNTMGTLEVEISTDSGVTFTQLIAPFKDNRDEWQNITINLSPYKGSIVQFKFKGTNKSNGSGGDIAIDDFFVGVPPIGVTNVTSNVVDGYYTEGSILPIEVTFDDTVTVTGTPQLTLQTGSVDQVINYTSGSGSKTLVFDYEVQSGDFTGDLDYANVFALTLNGGSILDANEANISQRLPKPGTTGSLSQNKTIKLGEIKSLPYTQNFDAFPQGPTIDIPIYELPEEWFNEINDDLDWTINSGSTKSNNTGPSSDNTTVNGSGKYIYVESSASENLKINLLSPLVDLTGAPTNTNLSFFYHMLGNTMGTLEVEISTDSGVTFTQLIAPFTDNKDEWQQKTISLSPYIGNTVQFRFKCINSSLGSKGDMAIDDFFVGVLPPVSWTSTGTTDDDKNWNVGANWSTGSVPTSTDDVIIPEGTTLPIITTGNEITINSLENKNGPITVEFEASIIVNSIVDGSITNPFNIQLKTYNNNWHLVAPPVKGATFVPSEVETLSTPPVEISTATGNVGIATYDNTADADGQWVYYNKSNTNTETFISGDGYAFKPKTEETIFSFEGAHADVPKTRPISIAQKGTTNENPWNLVGNPYPSRIDVATFLNENASVLKPTHQAVYIWNPYTSGDGQYELRTTNSIEIGQSFFVNSLDETGKEVIFSAASRTHTVALGKQATTSLKLLANGSYTNIKFVENATNGLDPRLDVGVFGGTSSSLQLFTKLVSGYEDVKFMQQSLSIKDIEESIVSLGVKNTETSEVEFKLEASNLPSDIYVYLEDKLTGTFTDLLKDTYKITVTASENSTGRFYLHTSARVLSNNQVSTSVDGIRIYQKNRNTIGINGLQSSNARVVLYSVLGKEVFNEKLVLNGNTIVNLPNLSSGVYIVNLTSELGTKTKKIVIN